MNLHLTLTTVRVSQGTSRILLPITLGRSTLRGRQSSQQYVQRQTGQVEDERLSRWRRRLSRAQYDDAWTEYQVGRLAAVTGTELEQQMQTVSSRVLKPEAVYLAVIGRADEAQGVQGAYVSAEMALFETQLQAAQKVVAVDHPALRAWTHLLSTDPRSAAATYQAGRLDLLTGVSWRIWQMMLHD